MTAISVDPLIAEARRRARRRRLAYVVATVLVAVGVVAAIAPRGGAPRVDEQRALARAAVRATVTDAGSVGRDGLWAMNGIGLWYSADGGTRWRTITPPVPGAVNGHVVQVQSLVLGRLFRTTDGGANWTHVARAPFQGWIEFTDARHGWGVAWEGPALYRTDDGGRTWTRVLRGYATLPQHGVVAVPGFVVAADGTRRALPVHVGGQAPVFAASSPTDFVFWARGILWQSSDAGRSWRRIASKVPPRSLWNLRFTSRDDGWAIFGAVTPTGYLRGAALAHTTNGGRDWTPLTPPVPRLHYTAPKPQCGSACRRP